MKDSASPLCLKKLSARSSSPGPRNEEREKLDRKLRSSKNPRGNHLNCRKRELFDGGRGKWAEKQERLHSYAMPQYPNWQPPPQERRPGNIYGRSFVIGGGFTYSQTSARHTQDKRARARMRMEEAQYCRGARYVRKSRIAARAAVHEEERGMRVLLDITYSSS